MDMISLSFLLLILAFICFILASFGVQSRIGPLPLGLAFWVLTLLLGGIR